MYKIGEFSKIVLLSVKTLRYYDDIGLLSPAHVDEDNGYRFYDEASYERALVIKTLKRYDFTIQEMLEAVDNIEDDNDLSAYLEDKMDQINARLRELHLSKKQLIQEISTLKEESKMKQTQPIEVKTLDDVLVATYRYKGRYDQVGDYLGRIFKVVGMHTAGSPFSLYYDEDYTEENADVEVCVPVKKTIDKDGVSSRVLKGQRVVSVIHEGPYDLLHESYKRLADYVALNNLKTQVPSRETYIKGPGMLMKGNPNKYQTLIQIPLMDE